MLDRMTLRDGSVVALVPREQVTPDMPRWYCNSADDYDSRDLRRAGSADSLHRDIIMHDSPLAWILLSQAGPTIDPNTAEVW